MTLPIDLPASKPRKGYKLKHIPSGLFYKPNGGFKGIVDKIPNLSKRGKIYTQPPKITELFSYRDTDGLLKRAIMREWEIVEIR